MAFERNNNEAVQHAENVGRILKLVFVRSVPYQRHDFSHGLLEGECPNHPINDAGVQKGAERDLGRQVVGHVVGLRKLVGS